jgi:hypothetical protein
VKGSAAQAKAALFARIHDPFGSHVGPKVAAQKQNRQGDLWHAPDQWDVPIPVMGECEREGAAVDFDADLVAPRIVRAHLRPTISLETVRQEWAEADADPADGHDRDHPGVATARQPARHARHLETAVVD